LGNAVGPTVKLSGKGDWSAGHSVNFDSLKVALGDATASFSGTAARDGLSGSFAAAVGELSRFAAIAGRPLAGQADVKASGTATAGGAFDLKLDGEATDLAIGIATLDPLMKGATRVAGGIARHNGGFAFDDLKISNDRVTANLNGSYGSPALDLTVAASIADLKLVTPRATGAASLNAHLTGSLAAPQVEAQAKART